MALLGQEHILINEVTSHHKDLTSQHKDLTRRHKARTSQHNYLTRDGRKYATTELRNYLTLYYI